MLRVENAADAEDAVSDYTFRTALETGAQDT